MSEELEGVPYRDDAQFWVYIFEMRSGANPSYFYAYTEEDARKQFAEVFGDDYKPKLLERKSW